MWDRERQAWSLILLGNILLNTVIASPIYVPQFIPGSTGRNIRHLPCVSRRTGETGVCMFAFTCAKANGTHLGTCIDRFYFGSCCKIDDEPEIFPQDNTIDDGPPPRPFVTTSGSIESNDIPQYFSRPKPINEKKPPVTHSTEVTSSSHNVENTQATTSILKETTKVVSKKPITTTIETTTQSMGLSTFQTVQNSSKESITTESTLKETTIITMKPQNPSSSINTTKRPVSSVSPLTTQRPTTLGNVTKITSTTQAVTQTPNPITKKPASSSSTTQKPVHSTTYKSPQSSSHKPVQQTTQRPIQVTTTTKTVLTTTQKIVPVTRFPPRNSTTVKPLTHGPTRRPGSSTKRPTISTSTKRPTSTTKKPSSHTKRPIVTTKPTTTSNFGTYSVTTTTRPLLTTSKVKPTYATTTESSLSSTGARPFTTSTETATTVNEKITSTKRPTTIKTTTKRPVVTTTTKKPSPTKISSTTIKTVSKPITTTEKTKPLSSTETSTVSVTRPKPTTTSTKPLVSSIKPVTKPLSTTSSVDFSTTTSSSTEFIVSTGEPESTTNVLVTKIPDVDQTSEGITQTTSSPGLVTWTSSLDDTSTKSPASTIATSLPDQLETQWAPITTPGWIMIPSPTTEKSPGTQEETTVKPVVESTSQSPTSAKPLTESTTTEHVTKMPTILSTLSTIASVTVNTELSDTMETLNMTDYKQVCGRRLLAEARIVGGTRSSFGKWPWQISLRQWVKSTYLHKCGAALLNENWAITAAHCVETVPPTDLLLRIGEHDLANEEEMYGYQERRVQIVASHPQFDPRTFEYDLALLRFYEPLLPFQPNILPICLPDDDETYVGRTAYVTGWGRLYDEGPLPSVLQEVAVPVINNTVCESMYKNAGYNEHIPNIFICAGWRNGGFDSCEGDSGGPMVIQRARDKRWILAGVISWGIGCAVPNQPGVYTRISEFREWINQILQF